MMPDLPQGVNPDDVDETRLTRAEAIITSMTHEERDRPEIIDGSRRNRIAKAQDKHPGSKSPHQTVQRNQTNDERRRKPNKRKKKNHQRVGKGKQNPRAKRKLIKRLMPLI